MMMQRVNLSVLLLIAMISTSVGADPIEEVGDPQRGYRLLTEKAYLPPDFRQSDFDAIWEVWPRDLRKVASVASVDERRQMAFQRYGLTTRPDDTSGRPLQYVVDKKGNWTMNCFACHGGHVYGEDMPGSPNNGYALQTLSEEMRKLKFLKGRGLTRMELGSAVIPLGTTNGTTNAVIFGVALMNYRDKDLNVRVDRAPPVLKHHDMDAPPWWNLYKKDFIYIDGFAAMGHRGLMQFMLIKENGPEKFREWERDFRDVFAYLKSLRPPRYKGEIDRKLAASGRVVFENTCAECHGAYGESESWPNLRIPRREIGTDAMRLVALPAAAKQRYVESWFTDYGADGSHAEADGYVAPPLSGIWASAPYLHNGSVPTLWHLLHPNERPKIWKRVNPAMDERRVGLTIDEFDRIPLTETDIAVRRSFFDTSRPGKSAAGHDYPAKLNEREKLALLEYLKTL